ncbi:hypothetical protein AAFF_G00022680 [Aldrovandia affinis]|uniref:Uncharacterized protein n=1 Tax=Aldrovandia affinis TaxID=143900 RepID=A0AAD7T5M9_9TELE|nr:hypothetical protein AAFF_G00022680 [Aldrovandia affinis]
MSTVSAPVASLPRCVLAAASALGVRPPSHNNNKNRACQPSRDKERERQTAGQGNKFNVLILSGTFRTESEGGFPCFPSLSEVGLQWRRWAFPGE